MAARAAATATLSGLAGVDTGAVSVSFVLGSAGGRRLSAGSVAMEYEIAVGSGEEAEQLAGSLEGTPLARVTTAFSEQLATAGVTVEATATGISAAATSSSSMGLTWPDEFSAAGDVCCPEEADASSSDESWPTTATTSLRPSSISSLSISFGFGATPGAEAANASPWISRSGVATTSSAAGAATAAHSMERAWPDDGEPGSSQGRDAAGLRPSRGSGDFSYAYYTATEAWRDSSAAANVSRLRIFIGFSALACCRAFVSSMRRQGFPLR